MVRRALDRLADDALDLTARRQQFVPIAILTLGNAGTSTDGFDQMFSEAAGHANTEQNVGTSLDPDIAAADFAPGQIVASTLAPTVKDYADFASVDPATIGTTPAAPNSGKAATNVLIENGVDSGYPPHTGLAARTSIHGKLSRFDPYGFSDI